MKYLFLFLICGVFSVSAQKKNIHQDQLPETAMKFIEQNFKKTGLRRAMEFNENNSIHYKVVMSDESEVEFDQDGNWKEIDGKTRAISDHFIPKNILQYIQKNYPTGKIKKIEKDRDKYEIELLDDTDLDFDLKGNFMPKK